MNFTNVCSGRRIERKEKCFEDEIFWAVGPSRGPTQLTAVRMRIRLGLDFTEFGMRKLVDKPHCRNRTHSSFDAMMNFSNYSEINIIFTKHNSFQAINSGKCQIMMNSLPFGYSICRPAGAANSMNSARQMFGKLSSIHARHCHGNQPPLNWYTTHLRLCHSPSAGALDFPLRQDKPYAGTLWCVRASCVADCVYFVLVFVSFGKISGGAQTLWPKWELYYVAGVQANRDKQTFTNSQHIYHISLTLRITRRNMI